MPATLPIRVSADARYVLWVNGREIGRGPVRSQPARWTYDEYDIAPALREGDNVIGALVTYYGEDNAVWQRARVERGLGAVAALVFDAPDEWQELVTNGEWTAQRIDAWEPVPSEGKLGSLPIEVIDHRRIDGTWTTSTDAPEWPRAQVLRARHAGAYRRSTPPAHPYGALHPRGIAALTGERIAPRDVRGAVRPDCGPVELVAGARELAASMRSALHWCELDETTRVPDGGAHVVEVDFGRIVAGFVEFDLEAPEGTVVDLAYLERELLAAGGDQRYLPRAGARVIAGQGRTAFRALETNGLRYIAMVIRPSAAADVRMRNLRVREHLYPVADEASFASSDSELERLWHAGMRTVQLNSVDAFTDCPTREQRAWTGDAVVHIGVHLATNSDWRLVRRHLELGDSPRSDGLLPMSVAGDIESDGGFSIPDWSLHWVHAVWMYARASGDREFILHRMPSIARVLAWFGQFEDATGVLADVPEWPLVDWSSVFTSGRSSILTGLWARALSEYGELSRWVGNSGDAARAAVALARAARGYEAFWCEERGVYVDHVVGGERQPAASQAANAAAIVSGIVPRHRHARIVGAMTDETRLVTRGWNAPSPEIGLEQKVRDRVEGVRRVDWDVDREIVRAEPFFSAVVHDAIAQAGHAALLPDLLRRWSRYLVDGYDTFGECWEWGTPSHGWSSSPTRDLIVHVLGVQPPALDERAYVVAPAQTDISRIEATVPTTAGSIRAEVVHGVLAISTPVHVVVRAWDGTERELPPGRHTVGLGSMNSAPLAASSATKETI
ncbi:alpha-L-rhamnosidase N-terminal domain-containing protein [Microbacterium sp. G2-8]|uniref:alpha-L-rhamnosidase-related protein n=1 Tax=Microbacterium sp. G2-8 TaxID=2842454 RepID=UPI001C89F877|nr:alpha-L-rhamnosidase N-terminal domain-containing protein [Microbacterium sp. G2-8]